MGEERVDGGEGGSGGVGSEVEDMIEEDVVEGLREGAGQRFSETEPSRAGQPRDPKNSPATSPC